MLGANRGAAFGRRAPALQKLPKAVTDLLEIVEPLIQLVGLPSYEIVHVETRCTTSPFDADDLADFDKREAKPLRPADEFEQPQRLGTV